MPDVVISADQPRVSGMGRLGRRLHVEIPEVWVRFLLAIVVLALAFGAAMVLHDLDLDVRLPEHVFAGQPMLARIVLRNRRRWLPLFSVNVVSFKTEKAARRWRWMSATFAFAPGHSQGKPWIKLPD